MSKKLILIQGALIAIIIFMGQLVPVSAYDNSIRTVTNSMAIATSEERLQVLYQHFLRSKDMTGTEETVAAWQRLTYTASAAVYRLQEKAGQTVDNIGHGISSLRQKADRPITAVVEKILSNRELMDFIGIQYHWTASHVTGDVNIYLVDDEGLLARIMDSIIGVVGYPKAAGGTLYPLGMFINASALGSGQFTRVEYHEYCHYYQQSVFGLASWFTLYSSEIALKDILMGDVTAGYDSCSWEVAANNWSELMVPG